METAVLRTPTVEAYFRELAACLGTTVATTFLGEPLDLGTAFKWAIRTAREAQAADRKLIFIGNGGSAAVASHMAIDFTKAGGLRAVCLNDGAALTCLSNDLGYEQVFAHQIEVHGLAGDLLVAISSSGRSPNILNAVAVARAKGLAVLTLSGFGGDNPLRCLGDVNLYVGNSAYGFVEISHLALCHAILDLAGDWQPS